MGSEYQTPSPQMLVARDGPKYNIDPALVFFCSEFWPVLLITINFHIGLFLARKTRILGHRHLPVLLRGLMIFWNINIIILLCIRWYTYIRAFLALDKEFPDQISMQVHNAAAIWVVFSIILGCLVLLTLLSIWRPRCLLGAGRIDEESRHNDRENETSTLPNPDLYNQHFQSWLVHISLVFAWLLTGISIQAKLPGAEYKNMPNAENFPPSGLQVPLKTLAELYFWLGLAGWSILTFVMFRFAKIVALFRIDVTNRCMDVWKTYKAGREVRRSNGGQLEGTTPIGRLESWSGWSSASTLPVGLPPRTRYAPAPEALHRAPSLETVAEASGSGERSEEVPSSWTELDEDLATPPAAIVRD
ncbi:hypothetical protein FQN54_007652 [Arachnomyces sp. PD_36]|nr:hypothetical protein FQN54_007652 [Arachnomyces sp. PD_36]